MQKILVIDDENDIRAVVVDTLRHLGYSASEAKDGREGVEQAKADPPDLILCDVWMANLNGYETLAAIRDLPALSGVPFIFLTGAGEKNEVRRGMASGADDYLVKPFTADELLEAITSRLARQSELRHEIYKQADKLHQEVGQILMRELAAPLDGILGLTADLMRNPDPGPPEAVRARARQINESILRLSRLTKTLA